MWRIISIIFIFMLFEKILTFKCMDSTTCPENSTCCYSSKGTQCCSIENAVCCPDMEHCCPSFHYCDASKGTCVSEDKKHPILYFIELKGSKKNKLRTYNTSKK